ncbi:MAG: hypothetical protein ABIN97_12845 [Ginsengibacter sp.]
MQRLFTVGSFFLSSLTFYSCGSTSKSYNEIIAYRYSNFKYELQLKYHTTGRGNIHQLNLSKYEYDRSDWIYLNSLNGKINADSLVFTNYQRKTEYPWKQSALKGDIQFPNDTTVKLNFQLPIYDDSAKIISYVPYRFNGIYKLIIKQNTAAIIDGDF